jgi:hypothetical protein
MIFFDLPSPADLPSPKRSRFGFAQAGAGFALGSGLWPARAQAPAGNRYPPRIKSGAGFFGIMR